MRKKLSYIVLIWFSFLSAQSQNLDSLMLEAQLQQDTSRILTLLELGKKLRRVDADSSINTLEQAYQQSVLINYPKGQVKAQLFKGVTLGMNDRYAESVLCFNEVIRLGVVNGYFIDVADAYNSLGIVYKRIGDYPTSYRYYNEALKIYKQHHLVKGMASSYENLGILHDLMGETDASFEFYSKAYAIRDSLGQEESKRTLLGNISIYYFRKKQYTKAISCLKDNLLYFDSRDLNFSVVNTLNNLSNYYLEIQAYDSAIYFATEGITRARHPALGQVVASCYYNRAMAYRAQGKLRAALDDALENNKRVLPYGYANRLESYDLLAKVYEDLQKPEKAKEAYKQVILLKDSLFEEDKVRQFKAEQVRQQVFDKNQQIQEQKADLENLGIQVERDKELRLFFIVITVLLLVTVFLGYQRYSFKARMNALLKKKNDLIFNQKKEIETINKELENRMLRAQINPHFIFNALSSIQHLIMTDDKKAALNYLTKFSSLLRQILENSIGVTVPIAEELKFLNIYLELESLRFEERFTYSIDVDPDMDIYDQEVPILLLQPFVENAILHGLLPKTGDKSLQIVVQEEDDYITYQIEDNGIGRETAKERKTKKNAIPSRGLSVTAQRIDLLKKGNKGGEVIVQDLVDPEGNPLGTQVEIRIPKL